MEEGTLSEEQAEKIKQHLLTQLTNFPEDKQEQIKQQILSMTIEDVEEFVKENQLDHLQQCVFCSIAQGKLPSYKIDENAENIAVLEINPLTNGHTLIVPKEHSPKNATSAKELAKKVSEKIKIVLKPKTFKVNSIKIMEHPVLEIIPIYDEDLSKSQKHKASEEELSNLQAELTKPIEIKEEPKEKKKEIEVEKIPPANDVVEKKIDNIPKFTRIP
ncbi:MAG: HIT domain-containing protein [archaeon]